MFGKTDATVTKIAARVTERNGWNSWRNHGVSEVVKFLFTHGPSLPKLPSVQELDRDFPVLKLDWPQLQNFQGPCLQATWMGHAACLVQTKEWNVLCDPVFSQRCSAVQWAGPKRYRPTPCTIEELVTNLPIQVVLISHNHYDHLDYKSILDLVKYSTEPITFVVPLGIRAWFEKYIAFGEIKHSIIELDWHESVSVPGSTGKPLDITAVPMQHWSSRKGWDRDRTLWCGFVLEEEGCGKGLFAGDTGWFDGLHQIGEKYGPFDLAFLPIGAYTPEEFMKPQHVNPVQAVEMMRALNARNALPIHWGTFQLTSEHYLEPREWLFRLLEEEKDPVIKKGFRSWNIGETVSITKQ